jgi:hypothetical protein
MEPELNVIPMPTNEAAAPHLPAPVSEAPEVADSASGNVDKIRDPDFRRANARLRQTLCAT